MYVLILSDCIYSGPCEPCPERCVPCPAILQEGLDTVAEEQRRRDEQEIIKIETAVKRQELLEKRELEIKRKREESHIKKAREFAVKNLIHEIAHRVETGESLTNVLASVAVNSKTFNSKSAKIAKVMREKQRQKEIAQAAEEQERRYRIEERTARAKGTYRPPHGTLYWLAQIACFLTFIGMIRAAWKCFNMTCLIKQTYKDIQRYVIIAMCCESRKCGSEENVST